MIYIYALLDPRENVVKYVGKTTNLAKRLYMHIFRSTTKMVRWREETHKARWIRKLMSLGISPEIKILEYVALGGNWQERERYWISYYRETIFGLTNASDGGDGVDAPRTDEWKRKIGVAHRGKEISEETRSLISKTLTERNNTGCKRGHPWTKENTIFAKKNGRGYRSCRECLRKSFEKYRRRMGVLPRGEINLRKEFCKKGHPLSGDNLRILKRTRKNGHEERICRECVRIRNRKCKDRKKAENK